MQTKHIALATLLVTTFAGNAFAFPASGEAPLFQNEPTGISTLSRQAVHQEAIASPPAVSSDFGKSGDPHSSLSRSEVRQETLDAISHGYRVKSGVMD